MEKQSTRFGIAGFVLAILSIILGFGFIGVFAAIIAIIFSSIQMKKNKTRLSVAGLVLGIIGLILSIMFIYSYYSMAFLCDERSFNFYKEGEYGESLEEGFMKIIVKKDNVFEICLNFSKDTRSIVKIETTDMFEKKGLEKYNMSFSCGTNSNIHFIFYLREKEIYTLVKKAVPCTEAGDINFYNSPPPPRKIMFD